MIRVKNKFKSGKHNYLVVLQSSCAGQALVEFALMLFLVMGICSGMLYISRLLTAEYWAAQEARFMAFEQTWAPYFNHGSPESDPINFLDDSDYLRRPNIINRIQSDANKTIEDDGSLGQLLPFAKLDPKPTHLNNPEDAPIMLAATSKSIWHRKTSEWFEPDSNHLVNRAYASQRGLREGSGLSNVPALHQERGYDFDLNYVPNNKLERTVVSLLEKGDFGGRFCQAAGAKGSQEKQAVSKALVRSTLGNKSECASFINKEFGAYLVRNTSIRNTFQDYSYRLEQGQSSFDALTETMQETVAHGFYSFFDQKVKNKFNQTPLELTGKYIDQGTIFGDSEYTDLLTSMRYMGSIVAMNMINAGLVATLAQSPLSRDWQGQKNTADTIDEILHADASNAFDVGINGFWLGPEYLPIPPTLVSVAGELFGAVMVNVLDQENSLIGPLVDDSNKTTEVVYDIGKGLFPAARRRFNTEGRKLTAKYYLVTQPWHIPRRVNYTGAYMELGHQDDSKGLSPSTDESMLRKRVFGLYIFPSRPAEFTTPLVGLIEGGTGASLDGVVGVFRGFDGAVSFVKDFVLDNPLNDVLGFINSMPWMSHLDMTFPEWPAVRPDAYPNTTEIKGDRLTGSSRTFADFISEQKDNNPKAMPKFHD